VVLRSGDVLDHEPVIYARGSWRKPLSRPELKNKFLDCVASSLSPTLAEELFNQLCSLEDSASIRHLCLTADGLMHAAL